jgi:hypothetical protein
MTHSQALILSCIPESWSENLGHFLENNLNLYSYKAAAEPGIVNSIYNEGPNRERIFAAIGEMLEGNKSAKVVIFSDAGMSGVSALDNYDPSKDLANQHELFLRHTVSIIRAKYKDALIEVYAADSASESFKRVI